MRLGKKVIVPGDGSSLWVITHNSDFAQGLVGLLALPQAIGHAFHITSDEAMSWDQFYTITAQAAGVEPQIVHIASDFITACMPDELGTLTGDKSSSVVFDNSKIKRFVPDFCAKVPTPIPATRRLMRRRMPPTTSSSKPTSPALLRRCRPFGAPARNLADLLTR